MKVLDPSAPLGLVRGLRKSHTAKRCRSLWRNVPKPFLEKLAFTSPLRSSLTGEIGGLESANGPFMRDRLDATVADNAPSYCDARPEVHAL